MEHGSVLEILAFALPAFGLGLTFGLRLRGTR